MKIETFRKILYLDLRPLVVEQFPVSKVKMLLLEMEEVRYKHQPLFEVEKERVFNVHHEYYQRLIETAGITFLNELRSELNKASSEAEKQYIISSALKHLKFYLLESYLWIAHGINSFTESVLKPALKHELVRLFVEVSSEQNVQINDEFIDEVYQRFYNERSPVPPMIHEATVVVLNPEPILRITEEENGFHTRLFDFRPEKKGILSYDTIIKNPKRFAEFEEQLYLYGLIDEEYNFTYKHGVKTEMAMKYHQMINEGCFMPRDFGLLKDIQPRDIRKFLDHRYNVNLDKQFRLIITLHQI